MGTISERLHWISQLGNRKAVPVEPSDDTTPAQRLLQLLIDRDLKILEGSIFKFQMPKPKNVQEKPQTTNELPLPTFNNNQPGEDEEKRTFVPKIYSTG